MLGHLPQVTKNLLLMNITMFVVTYILELNGTDLSFVLGAHYFGTPFFEPYQIITHMFMHGSVLHILFNMFILVMFGAHLERIWGAKRFFIFYIASGIGAFALYNTIGVIQIHDLISQIESRGYSIENIDDNIVRNTEFAYNLKDEYLLKQYYIKSVIPMVGASGALFGVLAGFAMLFPNTELMLLFPPIPIKAKYLIGGYLLFEIYSSFNNTGDGIAHLAHVGGAIVGIIFILVWRRRDRKNFW